jgi:hypothetical protein
VKNIFAILLIIVFVLAQYGKFISYAYCKWQAEIKTAACDCENILTEKNNPDDHTAQLPLNIKTDEPCVKPNFIAIQFIPGQLNSCFVDNDPPLLKGFESSLLRPPSGC